MTTWIYPDNVLVAILHTCSPDMSSFPSDRELLHSAFHTLAQQFPAQMQSFRFRQNGFFYESEALDQAFANLEASGLLERHNSSPRRYYIQPQLEMAYQSFVLSELMDAGFEESTIEQLGSVFESQVHVTG